MELSSFWVNLNPRRGELDNSCFAGHFECWHMMLLPPHLHLFAAILSQCNHRVLAQSLMFPICPVCSFWLYIPDCTTYLVPPKRVRAFNTPSKNFALLLLFSSCSMRSLMARFKSLCKYPFWFRFQTLERKKWLQINYLKGNSNDVEGSMWWLIRPQTGFYVVKRIERGFMRRLLLQCFLSSYDFGFTWNLALRIACQPTLQYIAVDF